MPGVAPRRPRRVSRPFSSSLTNTPTGKSTEGRKMRKLTRTRTMCAALLASSAIVSPAFAAAPAPRFVNVDQNGVDLTTGKVQVAFEEGGIGAGDGAVRIQRVFAQDAGWVDNYSGGMFDATVNGVTKTYVQIGGMSDVFTRSGTTFTNDNANGATVVYDTTTLRYTYTARDGTQIEFFGTAYDNYRFNCPGADPTSCYTPIRITKPNGLKINFQWESAMMCRDLPGEPCAQSAQYNRLIGIGSSAGYSATINYASSNIGAWPNPNPNWFKRSSIGFQNSASPLSPAPTITYGYPSSTVTTVTDPGGRQWTLTSDSSDRVTGIRRPGSTSDNISYSYGADGTVSSATKDGVTTTYARSVNLNTATETTTDASSNHTVTVSDLTKTRPTSFQDELGRTTAYQYDANGRVTKVTQPELNYTQLTYDPRGNVTATSTYDKAGTTHLDTAATYATCVTSGAGINISWCNKPQTITDARGSVTNYAYDPMHGGLTSVTRPAVLVNGITVNPQIRYSYTQVSSASGDAVYELTGTSQCQTSSSCSGGADEAKSTIAYNSNLLPTSVTRSNGTGTLAAITAATYDGRGRLDTIDGPLSGSGDSTKYRWDGADQLIGLTDPDPDDAGPMNMRAIRLTYRSDGQLLQQEVGTVTDRSDAAWSNFLTASLTYSNFNTSSRIERDHIWANGVYYAVRDYVYDGLGRVSCNVTKMNPNDWGAQATACAPWQVNGPFGPDRVEQTVYDAAGQVTQLKVGIGTAAAATERALTYTNNGLVQSLTDGENNKTSYVYDGFDRLAQIQHPNSAKGSGTSNSSDYEQFSYDANGNITSYRARGGGLINLGYDSLNRRTTMGSSALADRAYGYDLLDRPTSATFQGDGQGITNQFDALGRLTSTSSNVGGTSRALSYQYDLAGRRTHIGWWDGFSTDYARLVTGELQTITATPSGGNATQLGTFAYDNLRRRTSLTRGNGKVTTYTYDPVSRLASIRDFAGTSYDYTISNTYNPASQIASQTRSNDSFAYSGLTNVNVNYTSNGRNQYTAAGQTNFSYLDGNGNLTSDGATTFGYDLENKLTSTSGASTTTLAYDPINRLDLYTAGSSTRFVYDGVEVAAKLDAAGNVLRREIRGDSPDELLVEYNTSDWRYIHRDERGSDIAWSDPAGNVAAISTYDEYGVPKNSNPGTFQYTGQMWLPQIGVYNYKSRIYSAGLGRFLQTDPIGPFDDPNLHAYVVDDPINKTDPSGLAWPDNLCPSVGGSIVCTAGGGFGGGTILGVSFGGGDGGALASIGQGNMAWRTPTPSNPVPPTGKLPQCSAGAAAKDYTTKNLDDERALFDNVAQISDLVAVGAGAAAVVFPPAATVALAAKGFSIGATLVSAGFSAYESYHTGDSSYVLGAAFQAAGQVVGGHIGGNVAVGALGRSQLRIAGRFGPNAAKAFKDPIKQGAGSLGSGLVGVATCN